MLKKEITYKNFEDEEVTEVHYFNLSKPELIEWEANVDGGLRGLLLRIVEEKNNKQLINQFREIILKAYGQKSEDGKRFIKSPELSHNFSQSLAYETLYMELLEKENAASDFFNGILPADIAGRDQDKPPSPSSTDLSKSTETKDATNN